MNQKDTKENKQSDQTTNMRDDDLQTEKMQQNTSKLEHDQTAKDTNE